MLVLCPRAFNWAISCSMIIVSLLPVSRKAYVAISLSLLQSLIFTGMKSMVSQEPFRSLPIAEIVTAVVDGTDTEDTEVKGAEAERPWSNRVSVQGSGMRSLANITDSLLTTFSPPMTHAQTVKTQTVLHQKRQLVLMKDFSELPAWLKCVLASTMKTRRREGSGRSIWSRNHGGCRDRQGVLGRGVLGLRAWLGLELVWSSWLSWWPTKHWVQYYSVLLFHKFNNLGQ